MSVDIIRPVEHNMIRITSQRGYYGFHDSKLGSKNLDHLSERVQILCVASRIPGVFNLTREYGNDEADR